jgi:hypothetical protein
LCEWSSHNYLPMNNIFFNHTNENHVVINNRWKIFQLVYLLNLSLKWLFIWRREKNIHTHLMQLKQSWINFSFSSLNQMTGNQTNLYFTVLMTNNKKIFFLFWNFFFGLFFSSIFRFLSPLLFYQIIFRCD